MEGLRKHGPWPSYVAAAGLVVLASGAGILVRAYVTPVNLVMPYLVAVVICGRWWGLGSAVAASLLGVICFDILFVLPYGSFAVSDAEYLITFAALLVTALVIGTLTARLRDHAAVLRAREQETAALYAFSRSVVGVRDLTEIAGALVNHARASLGRPVSVLLLQAERSQQPAMRWGAALSAADGQTAEWALESGRPAGWDDSERPEATVGCIPLRLTQGTVGVLAAQHPENGRLTVAQRRLLEAFSAQGAVVVERIRLAEEARQAQLLLEAERLHDALLHSVSHSLRTPLASIIGSLSTLLEPSPGHLDPATRLDLIQTAREEAERLNELVGDLLDMARLEAGHFKLLIDQYDMEDVLGAALGRSARHLSDRPVHTRIDPDLPLVPLDQALIVQVLENLIGNAAKYSAPGSPIEIGVQKTEGAVTVCIADHGVGIPPEDRERVFEKFYRVESSGSPAGTGLGLSICKGIVEAHHGRIWAGGRAGGGTVITFALPTAAAGKRTTEVPADGER
ncbi:MAG TPA: ATP-binding protein [Symbiobacteriaceae bacterium]|nr:ATP-binding protein [Symbiobacteriaceae bacterium]